MRQELSPDPIAFVFGDSLQDGTLAGRTIRSARSANCDVHDATRLTATELAGSLAEVQRPVWFLRAGTWRSGTSSLIAPPPSATGLALAAVGWPLAALADSGPDEVSGRPVSDDPKDARLHQWRQLYLVHGGDISDAIAAAHELPAFFSIWLEPPIIQAVVERMHSGAALEPALHDELHSGRHRIVRYAPLDVGYDDRLRVLQVITSLQRGGAERIALDLERSLNRHGLHCRIATIGGATRKPFAVPAGTYDLSRLGPDRDARIDAVAQIAIGEGFDLIHAHLLDGDDFARLSAAEVPTLVTVHNSRPGWQAGQADLGKRDADLVVGCAMAVEAELHHAHLPIPLRTVWNGIETHDIARGGRDRELRRRIRQEHGIAEADVVLLSLANPRPQKRLPRLPGVVAALRQRLAAGGASVTVRLLLAGEASRVLASARQCVDETNAAAERLGVEDAITWLGPVEDVADVLAAADVLVSTSEFEGLSLAYVEAVAAGLPVVVTDAGGTRELAADTPLVNLLPLDDEADAFAETIAGILSKPAGRPVTDLRSFATRTMAARYAGLYPRTIAASRRRRAESRPREGLWLITNNFSTGGAQSSARRLLVALNTQGVPVRAAVLQEEPDHPTPGREALESAGIRVVSLPPAGTIDTAAAAALLLAEIDADPPQSVLFWNVIPEYKILLADGLFDIPVFDVSPGEMYFESLKRYFGNPRPGLPYRKPADYGRRLAGVIVKYQGEKALAERLLGAPVHVIPNGVPIDTWAPKPEHNGRLVIGTAARISPQKKLEELLEAVALAHPDLPPYILRIAGGVETGAEAYAKRLRDESHGLPVEWVGETTEMRPFLESLDLFAQVSEPAGCPNASLEALAAGLAVVATNVGGASEQVLDGVTGRVVPRGDPHALAAALIELATSPAQRTEFARAGRSHVERHFHLDRMAADYRRVCLPEM